MKMVNRKKNKTYLQLITFSPGISRPRSLGVTGVSLPSPRIVSTIIHPDISNLHSRYTLMTMQYAQFLDHDLTMTPIHKGNLCTILFQLMHLQFCRFPRVHSQLQSLR